MAKKSETKIKYVGHGQSVTVPVYDATHGAVDITFQHGKDVTVPPHLADQLKTHLEGREDFEVS